MGERLTSQTQTSAFVKCLKLLLMVFDLVFVISGIGILVLGIWMKLELYMYVQLTTIYYSQAPYVLIGVGCSVILFGMLGGYCTYKGKGRLLYLFSLFLLIIFVAELGVGIGAMIFKGKLETGFKNGLEVAMKTYKTSKPKQKAMDGLQSALHCCGSANYTDWFRFGMEPPQSVPKSCCITESKCTTTDPKDIYTQGCYTNVTKFMKKNFGIISGVAMGVAFFQLLGAVLAYYLAKNINKAGYDTVA